MDVTDSDNKASGMTEYEKRMLALESWKERKRQTIIAYLLWFFFAFSIIHRLYLGRVRSVLLLWLADLLLYFFLSYHDASAIVPMLAVLALNGLVWIFDLFYIPRMIQNTLNDRIQAA